MTGVGGVGEQFVKQLDDFIVSSTDNIKHGSTYYKPSGMYSCKRDLYYLRSGVVGREDINQQSISICLNGSWRHETLQNYLIEMSKNDGDIKWIDPEQYIKDNDITAKYGTSIKQRVGNEVKLFNSKYQLSFMCDGIIKFRDKIYILEIKTCASFIFNKLTDVVDKHKQQATCYSMGLGINDVIFLYENREVLSHKGFLYHVTEADKLEIANKIADVEEYINKRELPPREKDKCKYCCYKEQCRKDYNPLEETKNE